MSIYKPLTNEEVVQTSAELLEELVIGDYKNKFTDSDSTLMELRKLESANRSPMWDITRNLPPPGEIYVKIGRGFNGTIVKFKYKLCGHNKHYKSFRNLLFKHLYYILLYEIQWILFYKRIDNIKCCCKKVRKFYNTLMYPVHSVKLWYKNKDVLIFSSFKKLGDNLWIKKKEKKDEDTKL